MSGSLKQTTTGRGTLDDVPGFLLIDLKSQKCGRTRMATVIRTDPEDNYKQVRGHRYGLAGQTPTMTRAVFVEFLLQNDLTNTKNKRTIQRMLDKAFQTHTNIRVTFIRLNGASGRIETSL